MAKQETLSPDTASQITSLTTDQFRELLNAVTQQSAGTGNDALLKLATSLERMSLAQERQATATEKQVRHSNSVHPGISAFSYPEGNEARPKPKLDAYTVFHGHVCNEEQLTPLEIDLFNSITSAKTARKGQWNANYKPSQAGSRPELLIELGLRNHDDLVGLPPLVGILTELSQGADAVDVTKLYEKMADMAKELDILKQSQRSTEAVAG